MIVGEKMIIKTKKSKKKKRQDLIITGIVCLVFVVFLSIIIGKLSQEEAAPVITEVDEAKITAEKKQTFIKKISPIAKKNQKDSGLLASVSMAQAILESDWGTSDLTVEGKNLFGIKGQYKKQSIKYPTQEFENDEWITVEAAFRKYSSWEESMNDHVKLFKDGTTWNANQYKEVLVAKDYKKGTMALQKAGYATDPDYADKLVSVIEKYKLMEYD